MLNLITSDDPVKCSDRHLFKVSAGPADRLRRDSGGEEAPKPKVPNPQRRQTDTAPEQGGAKRDDPTPEAKAIANAGRRDGSCARVSADRSPKFQKEILKSLLADRAESSRHGFARVCWLRGC